MVGKWVATMIEKFFLGSDNRLCIEKKIDKFNGIKDFLFELWLFEGWYIQLAAIPALSAKPERLGSKRRDLYPQDRAKGM